MKYLLDEDEYQALVKAAEGAKAKQRKALQAFCTRVANELPVDWGWTEGAPKKPWGCILSTKTEWYCDECPAYEICPHEHKHVSK